MIGNRKCGVILLLAVIFLLAAGCAGRETAPEEGAETRSELPALDGAYGYLHIKVLAVHEEEKAFTAEVLAFGEHPGVHIGGIPAGETGALDCSDLMLFGSIYKAGSEWYVSYVDSGQEALPVRVYSLESPENFAQRAAQATEQPT